MRSSAFLILLFILLLSMGCHRKPVSVGTSVLAMPAPKAFPQIVFVNLEMQKDSITGEVKVLLLDHIVATGKLKDRAAPTPSSEAAGDVVCSFKDKSDKIVSTVTVLNPLVQVLEYSSEDGKYGKKEVRLQKAAFSIRTQIIPGSTTLQVQQVQPSLQLKSLASFSLSL